MNNTILTSIVSLGDITKGMAICSDSNTSNIIELNGQKFIPDDTKGYIKFTVCHGFPVITYAGQAMMSEVVAKSFKSLLHQGVNWEHQVVALNKEKISQDKFLGATVAVDFPSPPFGGWTMSKDAESSPGITAVATFFKMARGIDRIMGQHINGRHTYSVSMEVQYPFGDCAFAIELKGKKPEINPKTPDWMVQAGWELVPWLDAPEAMLKCFSITKNRIVSNWKNRKVVQLMGGLNNAVHINGIGIVMKGAEKEAAILQIAASAKDESTIALNPLRSIASIMKKLQ